MPIIKQKSPKKQPSKPRLKEKKPLKRKKPSEKAEFDAKKAARGKKFRIEWEMNTMLSTDELLKQAENNIATGVERITRRNMKESVAAYIIELSRKNENLSRNILHPKKSVANCFKYINIKAREYLEEDMKLTGMKSRHGERRYRHRHSGQSLLRLG